jgi:hypothetical protein
MIEAAGLVELVEDRLSVYTGPRIEELPGLSDEQRVSIAGFMEVDLGSWVPAKETTKPEESEKVEAPVSEVPEEGAPVVGEETPFDPVPTGKTETPEESPTENSPVPTYPGLVNQDIINLFYKAAALLGENGWQWLIKTGLKFIADTRAARFLDYVGPDLTEITGLSADQKAVIQHELNLYR